MVILQTLVYIMTFEVKNIKKNKLKSQHNKKKKEGMDRTSKNKIFSIHTLNTEYSNQTCYNT